MLYVLTIIALIFTLSSIIIHIKADGNKHEWTDDPDPNDPYWESSVEEEETVVIASDAVVVIKDTAIVVTDEDTRRRDEITRKAVAMASSLSAKDNVISITHTPAACGIPVLPVQQNGRPSVKEVKAANVKPAYTYPYAGTTQYSAYKYNYKKEEPMDAELVLDPQVAALVTAMTISDITCDAACSAISEPSEAISSTFEENN
jgi:hypothetical protein